MALTKLLALALATAVIYAAPTYADFGECVGGYDSGVDGARTWKVDTAPFRELLAEKFGDPDADPGGPNIEANKKLVAQVCHDVLCGFYAGEDGVGFRFLILGDAEYDDLNERPDAVCNPFHCPDGDPDTGTGCSQTPCRKHLSFDPFEWTIFAMQFWDESWYCEGQATSNKDSRFLDGPPPLADVIAGASTDYDCYHQCLDVDLTKCTAPPPVQKPAPPPVQKPAPFLFWKQECNAHTCAAGMTPKTTSRRCAGTKCTDAECCE